MELIVFVQEHILILLELLYFSLIFLQLVIAASQLALQHVDLFVFFSKNYRVHLFGFLLLQGFFVDLNLLTILLHLLALLEDNASDFILCLEDGIEMFPSDDTVSRVVVLMLKNRVKN